jgi:hypothetical protein
MSPHYKYGDSKRMLRDSDKIRATQLFTLEQVALELSAKIFFILKKIK